MLKKIFGVLGCLALVFSANALFFNTQTSAIDPNEQGCFVFDDNKPICPDKYCQSGSASCSNDGKRCYCKPQILSHSSKNSSCEIIFGSKIVFDKNNIIYLYGGLWSEIADYIPNSQFSTTIFGQKAIIFKKIRGKTYGSNYLTDLKNAMINNLSAGTAQSLMSMSGSTITSLIDADISSISGVGKVSNHRYQVSSDKGIFSCSHLHYGNESFFLKYSPSISDPYAETASNPCSMPSAILKLFVFGNNSDGWLRTEPVINLVRNCTDRKNDQTESLSGKFFEGIAGIFAKDNREIHLLMSNLIVPQGQSRKVYLLKPDNFLLGEIIDGTNNNQAIQKIEEKCNDTRICKNKQPPTDCIYCNSPIISALKNTNKSLNDVLQEGLARGDQAVCPFIDSSLDFVEGVSTPRAQSSWLERFLSNNSEDNSHKSEAELKLDKQLPQGVLKICERENITEKDRLNCKTNALKCYLQNLSESDPTHMCDNLTGPLETSRWLICPTTNALSAASDQSNNFLDKVFAINSAQIFNNPAFQKAWNFFKNVSNILLILVFVIIIASQISNIGLSNYNVKKTIPRLVVAAVLLNSSFFLAQIIVDASNIAGNGLYDFFVRMARDLQQTGVANISVSSISVGVIAGVGIMAILGGLLLLLPTLVILLIGLLFVVLMLSLRHGILVVLLLTMPIAIILNTIPSLDRIFNIWLKNFFNIILAYPIIGMLYGIGIYLKYLLYAVGQQDNLVQLIGFAMPILCLLGTPTILLMTTQGIKSLNNFVSSTFSKASRAGTQAARASSFNRAIDANQKDFGVKLTNSKISRGILKNKLFNTLTAEAGSDIIAHNRQLSQEKGRIYESIIDKDLDVLNAFHENNGDLNASGYQTLNESQQQKYRQLRDLNVLKDDVFYQTSFSVIASKGGANASQIKTILDNAKSNDFSQPEIDSMLFPASKIAEKSGNPLTSALITQNISSNKASLEELTKVSMQKVRPGKLRANDFQKNSDGSDSEATKILSNMIWNGIGQKGVDKNGKIIPGQRFNTNSKNRPVQDLNDHILAAFGEDFYQMPQELINIMNDDFCAAINTYYGESIEYRSAEEAFRRAGLIKLDENRTL